MDVRVSSYLFGDDPALAATRDAFASNRIFLGERAEKVVLEFVEFMEICIRFRSS